MDEPTAAPPSHSPGAWQPFSPGGVAAFAQASLDRLLVIQALTAALASAVLVWFLMTAWYPSMAQAVSGLPFQGKITLGHLEWHGQNPVILAENRFLGIGVDLEDERTQRPFGDLRFIFERDRVRCESIAGFKDFRYPRGMTIAFNRTDLLPRWGAWSLWLAILFGLGAGVSLLGAWWFLGLFYSIPVALGAWALRRPASLWGCWKLSAAAQLPGAVFLTLAIAGYRLGVLDLLRLSVAFATHFVITWLYLVLATVSLPNTRPHKPSTNPFAQKQPTNA